MKAMTSTLLWLAVAVLMGLAAVFVWQDRLLYFPERASVERIAGDGLLPWPSAQDFRGLVAEPPGAVIATAIVFHGNAGHAGHRAFYARALVPLGLRVILAEYPGYGPRGGSVGEAAFVADAVDAIALARRQHGGRLIVIGESLGAAVAAGAVAQAGPPPSGPVDGLLLITPWDRLGHVASHHYPWLPVGWLLRDGYDSAAALARFDRPVIVAVAAHDTIVPPRFGQALHDALPGPKQLRVIEASGHNDWPERVDATWWRSAVAFLLALPR